MAETQLTITSEMVSPDLASLEQRLNELHQMLYRRGGIRPVNAAIEELSKLLLLQLKRERSPDWVPTGGKECLAEILDPHRVRSRNSTAEVKAAFRAVVSLPEFAARLPDGGTQSIWPEDEPLRIDRADVLAEALEVLADHFSLVIDHDLLGVAFDVFLRGRYDHAGGLGTYLTPHQVTTALARLTLSDLDLLSEPPAGPIAGDPCCGTGRFPVAILQEVERLVSESSSVTKAKTFEAFKQGGLFGADQSSSSVAKARINLLLYGIEHPNVFTVSDSIIDPHVDALRGRLKLILTNPPFGDGQYDSVEGIRRISHRLPALQQRDRIDPAIAFLLRCIDLLADGGRLGIILPDGLVDGSVLRRSLLSEGNGRIKEISIEANLSLPTVTFAPAGTMAKTSALVLRRSAASRSTVFLGRAEHIGYVRNKGSFASDPDGNDLPTLADLGAQAWTADGRRNGTAAADDVDVLCENPLAALVARADLQTVDPSRIDPEALSAHAELRKNDGFQLQRLLSPVSRRAERATGRDPFVSVLHIDDLGSVAWEEAERHSPTTPGPPAFAGELIVSLLNPKKLRATVIPDAYTRVLCSSEFGVFQVDGDPYEALVLLHDPRVKAQLAPLGRGTSSSRRRIDASDLLSIYAPSISPNELGRRAVALKGALDSMRDASLAAAAAYQGPSSR